MSDTERFRPFVAVHLLLIREEKVLLVRRFQTGWQDGTYGVLAGHIDGNETIRAAMIREAKEEGGIDIKPEDLRVSHAMHRLAENKKEYIDFFLTTEKWEGEPRIMEPDKCDDLQWFPLGSLPENMVSYVRSGLEQFLSHATFSEFGWADQQ
jgi:8-oxo-dGTP diphosphatase